jgi:hypothetical protein
LRLLRVAGLSASTIAAVDGAAVSGVCCALHAPEMPVSRAMAAIDALLLIGSGSAMVAAMVPVRPVLVIAFLDEAVHGGARGR